jgi:hypothetical protein
MPGVEEPIFLEPMAPLSDQRVEMSAITARGLITVRLFTESEWNRDAVDQIQFPPQHRFVVIQPNPLTCDVIFPHDFLKWNKVRAAIPALSKLFDAKLKMRHVNGRIKPENVVPRR